MNELTYRQIESEQHNCIGVLLQQNEVVKGELWPLFFKGTQAVLIQLDDVVLCMSVIEKENYLSGDEQIAAIANTYLNQTKYKVRRVIACGEVEIFKLATTIIVTVGGQEIASLNTHPISTNIVVTQSIEDREVDYFIDLMHEHLYDPLIKRSGLTALIHAMISLRKFY